MRFGGKVFVIGVGPSETKVGLSKRGFSIGIALTLFQFPFGYLSANEIDLQTQYRYANQVSPNPLDIIV